MADVMAEVVAWFISDDRLASDGEGDSSETKRWE
jgi:hypothetical protein